jgi:hypothetical protein
MRDQSVTLDQAAKWLNCAPDKVQEYLASGRLQAFAGANADASAVSLNSVIVLAEALPVEAGIFRIRESSSSLPGPDMGYSPRPHGGPGGSRPPVVVERKPTRGFTPRS